MPLYWGFVACMPVFMADSEGFEPSVPLPVRILSRDVVSANSPNCPEVVFVMGL